jgi:hypothetical protein
MKYLFALLFVLFISCSPKQKLSLLLKRHPELIKQDTVHKIDTIVINGHRLDTVFYYKQTDTIIKKENGITLKYFYNTRDSTVYLEGKRDTIVIIREVNVPSISLDTTNVTWYQKLWFNIRDYLFLILFGAFIVLFILFKKLLQKR